METVTVNGDNDLQQQEDDLNFQQNTLFAHVTDYTKGEEDTSTGGTQPAGPQHLNDATLEEVGIGVAVKRLYLVAPKDLDQEKIIQAGAGRSLVFDSEVYVSGVVTRVAGFR